MPFRPTIPAPTSSSLPARRDEKVSFSVPLVLVTPVLGGGPIARQLDDVDYVRVPTIRGHLRFWWRALEREATTPEQLHEAERELWGGARDERADRGGRSSVEVGVRVEGVTAPDPSEVEPNSRFDRHQQRHVEATPGAYALFPARSTRDGTPPAPRRPQGTRFELTIRCPKRWEREVRDAVQAWILFGGYGSRTRRGLGSLSVVGGEAHRWLPAKPDRAAIAALFGADPFGPNPAVEASSRGRLAGAELVCGTPCDTAMDAWVEAVDWLRAFRQDPATGAREPDPDGRSRPSLSNWPEADKLRHLSRMRNLSHQPRHKDEKPVWPRAGFGLPIVGQFQRKGRKGERYAEPKEFELRWSGGERLASALIVKPLPLQGNRFAPCALWLDRTFPSGKVVAYWKGDRRPVRGSEASFDELVARGDEVRFRPLAHGQRSESGRRLRTAFMTWLREHKGAR